MCKMHPKQQQLGCMVNNGSVPRLCFCADPPGHSFTRRTIHPAKGRVPCLHPLSASHLPPSCHRSSSPCGSHRTAAVPVSSEGVLRRVCPLKRLHSCSIAHSAHEPSSARLLDFSLQASDPEAPLRYVCVPLQSAGAAVPRWSEQCHSLSSHRLCSFSIVT